MHATYRTHDGVVGLKFFPDQTATGAAAPGAAKGAATTKGAPTPPPAAAATAKASAPAAAQGDADNEEDEEAVAALPFVITRAMLGGDQAALRDMLRQLRDMARAATAQKRTQPQGSAAKADDDDDNELAFEDGYVVRLGKSRWTYEMAPQQAQTQHASNGHHDEDEEERDDGAGAAQRAPATKGKPAADRRDGRARGGAGGGANAAAPADGRPM